MTVADLIDEQTRPQPKRDRWGRPTLLDRDTGKRVAYTRPTTIAKTLSDMHTLMKWESRMVAIGLATRQDLLAAVASTPADDKEALNRLTEQAKEAAAASAAATTGTAVHKFLERVLAGDLELGQIPEPWRGQVGRILDALTGAGFTVLASEQFLVTESIQAAGTADLILAHADEPDIALVGDLKTGASVQWGAHEWAVQLSIYSCADHLYDWSKDKRLPVPWALDSATGVIVHAHGSDPVTVWRIDLAEGARALHHSLWTRTWRFKKWHELLSAWPTGPAASDQPDAPNPAEPTGRAVTPRPEPTVLTEPLPDDEPPRSDSVLADQPRQLPPAQAQPDNAHPALPDLPGVSAPAPADPTGPFPEQRHDWLMERIGAWPVEAKRRLAQLWPVGVPTFKQLAPGATHQPDQQDALEALCDRIEGDFQLPFFPNVPAQPVIPETNEETSK